MKKRVFRLSKPSEYKKAGPSDLIELASANGTSLYFPKHTLEIVVSAIADCEIIHLSGPTGSGKTALIEALYLVPETFSAVCAALGRKMKSPKVLAVEMATFDAPGELWFRRALKDGSTYDEPSVIINHLEEAAASAADHYPVIWLKEMGRVHSASVQGGLLNLVSRTGISLPTGKIVDVRRIAWIADSNYQAESDATHTLVPFDDALKRRFTVNLTMDHLTAEQESYALHDLLNTGQVPGDKDVIASVVRLGQAIRRHRAEGGLQSIAPPSIYGYLAMLRRRNALPHLALGQVAIATLLGNANTEDANAVTSVLNEVFGYQGTAKNDGTAVGNLI